MKTSKIEEQLRQCQSKALGQTYERKVQTYEVKINQKAYFDILDVRSENKRSNTNQKKS